MFNEELKSESEVIKLVQERARLKDSEELSKNSIDLTALEVPQSLLGGHPDIVALYKPDRVLLQREAEQLAQFESACFK